MSKFDKTNLWQKTLAVQIGNDAEESNRTQLREAFLSFRKQAGVLAGEIAISFPELTVHDITHLDALWEMADLIIGNEYPLNPAEAFVLGGAFLIHDLGNGLAAYTQGIDELKKTPLWFDTVTALLKKEYGRQPTHVELNNCSELTCKQTMHQVLRQLHAKHAETLALASWKDSSNLNEYSLIIDPIIRNTYGPIIGKIAHSHWWPTEKLISDLPPKMGASGEYNNSWTVDPVKIACILRVADASHLDDRRAPGFLKAIRKPLGISLDHWAFQEKLNQPRLEADRLTYTSKNDFLSSESNAWWTCFDALQVVDYELRKVDGLLAETNRPRFDARGVTSVDNPQRMAKYIGTMNWLPVDAKIKVGNVASLIASLGGEKLYGHNETVPLRELIQNACDAVKARRLLENRPDNWGSVIVRTGKDSGGRWIEVEDTGIGMSSNVLTGPFLDFGNSLWGTPLMHEELPGLESKGFVSSGHFGIGFFSVFMWGNKVQISTRRAERARDETLVLEFQSGLGTRPILRKAESPEYLLEGGTRVRVWLSNKETFERLLRNSDHEKAWTLKARCAWLCPTLDVDLYVESDNKKNELVVASNDWISIKPKKLLQRLHGPESNNKKSSLASHINSIESKLRLLENSDNLVVGRAGIVSRKPKKRDYYNFNDGVVTVGGFRSCELTGVCGVLIGTAHTAARDVGVPIVDSKSLQKWATEQSKIISNENFESELQAELASRIHALGGSIEKLHFAEGSDGWKTEEEIANMNLEDEILIIQDASLSNMRREFGDIKLLDNVYAVSMGWPGILQTGSRDIWVDWPKENNDFASLGDWTFRASTLEGALISAISKSWNIPFDKVLKESKQSTDNKSILRVIGTCNGNPVEDTVEVIKKPRH